MPRASSTRRAYALLDAVQWSIPRSASSGIVSELFGKVREVPQTGSAVLPRSPYGVSKVFAHYITVNYRESYNLFAVSGCFQPRITERGLDSCRA
jgi:GDP-D-mannose dehydratase